ncbi:LysR family transcriptional regulator [Vibrio renipiscarius]|uniref:LysR family transcriptional regulator n=1 Tax=Vibrio renipiscarius TaxID=1461322 RepID=A0A0C2JQ91_9VIBR|nr:LysR family transcriptional regulator [Vibrio renipiscarius]KII80011.1 LysR family transcriptional regulator [Vibrio renipiscarius]KII80239.1 LysR family transcriptional regulator [Vibrio renipiscarius]
MLDDIAWRNIDLNLLVTFSYLYRYRSVSIAAEKNFVSQSAMSHSLSRLRVLLDDPLFIRKGYKMEPTEHAHHIAPTLHQLLNSIAKDLLTKTDFDPSQYSGVCRIGLTDYAEFIFAPALYDEIMTHAPEAQISFINVNRSNYVSLVEQEKLDIVIGSMPVLDDDFESQYLYTEKHVCLADKQALKLDGALTLEAFSEIEQALVSPDGSLATQVDKKLAEHGLSRRVTVASRNFLTIRSLLKARRLIAIVPEKMAQSDGFDDQLTIFNPPVSVADFDIAVLWHNSRSSEDKNIWLRTLVERVVAG